jgi:glucosamine--fructose-6-phosphate aminotransferase (isomerizing)
MCGIVGYVGPREAVPVLLDGLRRLAYRGYDSAGVALLNGRGIATRKVSGELSRLEHLLRRRPVSGRVGIGHTRWATHGEPSERNAHPHTGCEGALAVVHNGIIENFSELRAALERRRHRFRSETDTETIVHTLEEQFRGDPVEAVRRSVRRLRGSFALQVLFRDWPEGIVAVRQGCPLIVGLGEEGELYCASDVPALLPYTRRVVYLQEGDLALLSRRGLRIFGADGRPRAFRAETVALDAASAEKGGFAHFMLKEIHEQPQAVADALRGRIDSIRGEVSLAELPFSRRQLRRFNRVVAIACGTAWHASLVAKQALEEFVGIPVQAEFSSEFRYGSPALDRDTLVLAISQSGETADTLAGVRLARERGAPVLGICNVAGSSLSREADGILYTRAGPEIGVASTKAYLTQLAAAILLSIGWGRVRGTLSQPRAREMVRALEQLPGMIRRVLADGERVRRLARRFVHPRYGNFMFVGRGYNYPTAFEGALKLKEISYRHAEGYGAGEMKHGPLALVDRHLPVMAVAVPGAVYEKTLSNLQEIRARGGCLIGVGVEGDERLGRIVRHRVVVPRTAEPLSPMLTVVPLQLFAYHLAVGLGRNVDRPRNLAKSVTVE